MKLKREAKVIIVIVSIVLIAGLIGTCVLLNKKEVSSANEPTIGINTEEASTTIEAVIEEEKEEQPISEVEEEKVEQTKPTTTQKTTVSTSKKVSQTKANTTKQTVATTTYTAPTTTKAPDTSLPTCSDGDAGWQSAKQKLLDQGQYIFDSYSEASNFYNQAKSKGWNVLASTTTEQTYASDTCIKKYYKSMLSLKNTDECQINGPIFMKSRFDIHNLPDMIDVARNGGYCN